MIRDEIVQWFTAVCMCDRTGWWVRICVDFVLRIHTGWLLYYRTVILSKDSQSFEKVFFSLYTLRSHYNNILGKNVYNILKFLLFSMTTYCKNLSKIIQVNKSWTSDLQIVCEYTLVFIVNKLENIIRVLFKRFYWNYFKS